MVANSVQGRVEKPWLKDMINKDVLVLMSGSRFFRGPPHCGAVIIPPIMMNKLKEVDNAEIKREWGGDLVPTGLNTFFGKNEFPPELSSWRDTIEDNQNPGLALRWVASLAEMEPNLEISTEDWNHAKKSWNTKIT